MTGGENDRRKDRVYFMIADREAKKEIKGADKVCGDEREFGGTQTMQQAFDTAYREKDGGTYFKKCSAFSKKDRQAV